MEQESFENERVAEILNRYFVAIKVDREERPDVDLIYMAVCQAMTGQGGWPLTILMTPDQKPFFAGTYFPRERRYGRPGLIDVLSQIADKWKNEQGEILRVADEVVAHFRDEDEAVIEHSVVGQEKGANVQADPFADGRADQVIRKAAGHYSQQFDDEFGGFGSAPKFPSPHNLMFLLRYGHKYGSEQATRMVIKTLDAMYAGGMYDHVGFGFARYSVDEKWLVPHFEKMLYDNALLALAYLEGYQVTGDVTYAQVAQNIFTYVLRDMRDAAGGFYSAEDADSEGEEGKFYVWTPGEIRSVLGDELGEWYCKFYDVTSTGNFEGHNIPNLIGKSFAAFAKEIGVSEDEWRRQVQHANEKLFAHRDKRVHPGKDDKILTSWNGLMIAALAKAGRVLPEETGTPYLHAARDAVEFVLARLVTDQGRLLARYRDGDAGILGYLDDYAFFVWGLLELYEVTFDETLLEQAVQLTRAQVDLFWDATRGGFYFYGKDAEALITRPKEIYDGAMPSGNSVATLNLLRLARMTGDSQFEELAERQIGTFFDEVARHPMGFSYFLMAVQFALGPTKEIVIAGDPCATDTAGMVQRLHRRFLPDAVLLLHPENAPERAEAIESLAEFIKGQRAIDGKATVYVCQGFACQRPQTDLEAVMRQL